MCPAPALADGDARALPPSATFGELVTAARSVAAGGKGASSSGCLLRPAKEQGTRLEASLALGVPEVPEAPEDLDALLEASGDAALTTASARTGNPYAGLQLVALTPVPSAVLQSGLLPILIRTDRGTWFTVIAPPGTFSGGSARAQLLGDLEFDKLKSGVLTRAAGVVVAAERGTSLAALMETLGLLEEYKGPVVLATALPEGAKLPERPEVGTSRDPYVVREKGPHLCAGDTMAIPPGGKHGQLPMDESAHSVDALQAEVTKGCATLARTSGGGILKVSTRIGKDGRASSACIEDDPTKDAKLRACVVGVLKKFKFPKPVGGNFVNFGTTVSLAPPGSSQRALCAP